MKEFFAHMYRWFGFIHLYSKDFDDYLKGWDFACVGYFALPWYLYVGWMMIILTTIIFALQYDIISPTRWTQRQHWGLVALAIVIVNFLIAFTIPFVFVETGAYCLRLTLSVFDCIGFGISNAGWGFVLFVILNGIQPVRGLIKGWRNPVFRK